MKNKKAILSVLVVALFVLSAGLAWAAGNGIKASKATVKVSELQLIEYTNDYDWDTILEQNIKTPNQKDLIIDVSLETGLYTFTHVKSKRNDAGDDSWDTSWAQAKIMVRVLVDDKEASVDPGVGYEAGVAFPRQVTFNDRIQTLSAKFMGIFDADCFDVDPDTGEVTIIYEELEYEELKVILETLSANSFNFVAADLTPGDHTIKVQAKIVVAGDADEGTYEARALVGQGSVVIELVRMIRGEDYLELD